MGDLRHQQVSPSDAEIEARKEKALTLRIAGASYRQIARTLGVGVATAHEDVVSSMAGLHEDNKKLAKESRDLDLERLDGMLVSLWEKRKDPRFSDTILRIMQRRADLLGMDAPRKLEQTGAGGAPLLPAATMDLKNLTLEQLRDLEAIVIAAEGPASSG